MSNPWKLNRPQLAGVVLGVFAVLILMIAASQCGRPPIPTEPVVVIQQDKSPRDTISKKTTKKHVRKHKKKSPARQTNPPDQRNHLDEVVNRPLSED